MRTSKSKILCFEQCRFRYKKETIDRIKPKVTPAAFIKGCAVHTIFEEAFTDITISPQDIKDKTIAHPDYKKYKKIIENFFKFMDGLTTNGKFDVLPVYVEEKIHNKEVDVAGVIDLVLQEGNNLILLDYKTGKSHTRKDAIVGDDGELKVTIKMDSKYYFELALYVYLFEQHFNREVTHYGIFFAEQDKLLVEKVDREEITKALERVKKVTKEIQECIDNNYFAKTPSYLCKYCTTYQNGYCDGRE